MYRFDYNILTLDTLKTRRIFFKVNIADCDITIITMLLLYYYLLIFMMSLSFLLPRY